MSAPWVFEPDEVYHSKSNEYLSSHMIGMFMDSPALYKAYVDGLVRRSDTPWFSFGSAAHKLILEGESKFMQEYAVGNGPINPSTGLPYGKQTKKYGEWLQEQPPGKKNISTEDCAVLLDMYRAVFTHPLASEMLILPNAVIEGVIRYPWYDYPCQVRIDWYNEGVGVADLKTCESLSGFEYDSRKYNYTRQMAFYRGVLERAGVVVNSVYLIAVEKRLPYRVGVWMLSPDSLNAWADEIGKAIMELKRCQDSGNYPTGFEEIMQMDYQPKVEEIPAGGDEYLDMIDL